MNANIPRFFAPGSTIANLVAAVAIQHTGEGRFHAGVVYFDKAQYHFLNLEFHFRLTNPSFNAFNTGWVEPPINSDDAGLVAALCKRVWETKPKLPYHLRWDQGSTFSSATGKFIPIGDCKGLTCATFVLAIYNGVGVKLINEQNWQSRDGDQDWQNYILSIFETWEQKKRKDGDAEFADELVEHIKNVKTELGSLRYRPEDVTGACVGNNLPATFEDATVAGSRIREVLMSADGRDR